MVRVACPRCGKPGTLSVMKVKGKDYLYVAHKESGRVKRCYVGKEPSDEVEEYFAKLRRCGSKPEYMDFSSMPLKNEVEREIILSLARKEMSKYDLAETLDRAYSAIHKVVNSLLSKGLITTTKRVPSSKNPNIIVEYYQLTRQGMALYGSIVRSKIATLSMPVIQEFELKLRRRMQATIDYMVPRLIARQSVFIKKLGAITAMYTKSGTLGLLKLKLKEVSAKLEAFANAVSQGADFAVYPSAEDLEEEAVMDAAIILLSRLLCIPTYRRRVAEVGQLSVVLTLDLSQVDMPPEEKSEALFWSIVYEGLSKAL